VCLGLPTYTLTLNLKVMPLECGHKILRKKSGVTQLPHEEIVIIGRTKWAQSTSARDRQTDL